MIDNKKAVGILLLFGLNGAGAASAVTRTVGDDSGVDFTRISRRNVAA
ncbi:MAG: hypothetical protein U9R10_04655 [Euryarchaeota archaeon]|nr:hypothetical protein [Euryarchaeota archaeon]